MQEINLAFIGQVLLGCAIVAAIAIASPWIVQQYHRIMSRLDESAAAAESVEPVVYRPVDATSMDGQTTAPAQGGMDVPLADMDAVGWPRYLSDDALTIFLAAQKLPNGKYRSSANKIVAYIGGDRNHILKLVREVREGVPQYPQPLTPEQAATRAALALDEG